MAVGNEVGVLVGVVVIVGSIVGVLVGVGVDVGVSGICGTDSKAPISYLEPCGLATLR